MGLLLFLATPMQTYLPCATSRALTTCTTTLLRSLGDPSGVFDTPKVKCPPDRGSSDWVTDSPAPIFSTSPSFSSKSFKSPTSELSQQINHLNNIGRPISTPRAIPTRSSSGDSTPPLSPDEGSDCGSIELPSPPNGRITPRADDEQAALEFLMNIFPRNGLQALPYAKKVSISAPNMGAVFEGVVLELPNQSKTLYVDGKSAEAVSLRESIVALLDLADERLGCSALVIVLERASLKLSSLLHSLMYVGGTVVTKPVYQVDPAYVLVGLEI